MKTTSHLSLELSDKKTCNQVLLIDFNDSFSFNIVSELLTYNVEVECISYEEIKMSIEEYVLNSDYSAVILGPGPGNPQSYFSSTSFISTFISKGLFVFGICLGHQILALHNGFKIEKSRRPIHGETEMVLFSDSFDFGENTIIQMQRYNSLAVVEHDSQPKSSVLKIKNKDDEVVAIKGKNFLSYQFHPESVGTSCRKHLFQPLLDFLYNNKDEDGNKN